MVCGDLYSVNKTRGRPNICPVRRRRRSGRHGKSNGFAPPTPRSPRRPPRTHSRSLAPANFVSRPFSLAFTLFLAPSHAFFLRLAIYFSPTSHPPFVFVRQRACPRQHIIARLHLPAAAAVAAAVARELCRSSGSFLLVAAASSWYFPVVFFLDGLRSTSLAGAVSEKKYEFTLTFILL